jgi:hypothetical protein
MKLKCVIHCFCAALFFAALAGGVQAAPILQLQQESAWVGGRDFGQPDGQAQEELHWLLPVELLQRALAIRLGLAEKPEHALVRQQGAVHVLDPQKVKVQGSGQDLFIPRILWDHMLAWELFDPFRSSGTAMIQKRQTSASLSLQ